MDYATARTVAHAWQVQPKGLRREVVELSRNGHPTPDRTVGRLAVDWGLSQDHLDHGRLLAAVAIFGVIGLARAFEKDQSTLLGLAALIWQLWVLVFATRRARRYDDAVLAATVNLRPLLVEGAYLPLELLEVRAIGRPRWLIAGYAANSALFLAYFIWVVSDPDSWTFMAWFTVIVAVVGGGYFLVRHRRRRRANLRRRPRPGAPVVTLDRTGLQLHQLGQTVPWSRLVAAELIPVEDDSYPSLAVSFTASDPALTVAFETQWLDQHPGVILATARQYLSTAARSRL
jgi:hypothetical protein